MKGEACVRACELHKHTHMHSKAASGALPGLTPLRAPPLRWLEGRRGRRQRARAARAASMSSYSLTANTEASPCTRSTVHSHSGPPGEPRWGSERLPGLSDNFGKLQVWGAEHPKTGEASPPQCSMDLNHTAKLAPPDASCRQRGPHVSPPPCSRLPRALPQLKRKSQ